MSEEFDDGDEDVWAGDELDVEEEENICEWCGEEPCVCSHYGEAA